MGLTSFLVTTAASASRAGGPGDSSVTVPACGRPHYVCNRRAWQAMPLGKPDAAGATLMTESQAISDAGWQSGGQVGAQEMTYGQAMNAYPSVAGENFIDQTRPVWIVTLYYPTSIPNPGSAPAGVTLPNVSSVTIVIDAATGVETDWCAGCSTVPASATAAHAAVSSSGN